MNTTRSSALASTRFSVSRAQLSPLSRPASFGLNARVRSSNVRTVVARSARPASAPQLFPNFWSSGELDRLQPAVTRYHD